MLFTRIYSLSDTKKSFQVLNFEKIFVNDLLLQINFASHDLADEITITEITLNMNN